MLPIIGIIIIFVAVFGGYISSGGKIEVIMEALPHEMFTICGAILGAYLIANKGNVAKATLKDLVVIFKGGKWNKKDYLDLLCLMFLITKTMKSKGIVAIESHIENPGESPIFSPYPKIMSNHFAIDFICDTLRMFTMSFEDPYQVEDMMDRILGKHHHEALAPATSIQNVADALPAIGIVAAVLGVIKTMASIDKPPEILGEMIGGALVGTFMGVFMAYCFVGPFANKITAYHDQDGQFYKMIKDIMISHLKGNAPQVSIEIGRTGIPTILQPTFPEVEAAINELKIP